MRRPSTTPPSEPPDIVILDLGLPGIDGLEVITQLRSWTRTPIVVLSARGAEADQVAALDAGADDYVAKPFGMDELLARLRASLRRSTPDDEPPVVVTDHFRLDLADRQATGFDGTTVHLTPTEWHILDVLAARPGQLVTHRRLLGEVWGPSYSSESNYLRVHMANLRRKLEPDPSRPRYLITEPGIGHRFEPPAPRPTRSDQPPSPPGETLTGSKSPAPRRCSSGAGRREMRPPPLA